MKIVILTSTFPKNSLDNVPRFIETQIINLKNNFPNLEFYVLAPENTDSLQVLNTNDYKQIRYRYFWPKYFQKFTNNGILNQIKKNRLYYLLIPFFIVGQFLALSRLVKQEKVDLIYAHWFFPQAVTAYIVSKIYNIQFSFTSHSSDLTIVDKKIPFFGKLIIRKVCKSAKSISTPSYKIMSLIENYFTPEEFKRINHYVIPMGINSDDIVLSKEVIKDKNNFTILFLGRFSQKKGVDILIESIAYLNEKNFPKKIQLKLAGDGEEKENYNQQIQNLNLSNFVEFVGYVNEDMKYNLIQKSDLLVVPSVESNFGDIEGMPVVILEGLYCKTPVLASEYTNATEIITDSFNGFIIKDLNPNELATKIFQIINFDKDSLQSLIKNGFETAKQFSSGKNSQNFYKFLI